MQLRTSWPRFRWVVVAMLAGAAGLNYLDRQTLALMAGDVQADLKVDDAGYALLVNAFLAAYMSGGIISAWIVDRIDGRRAMALFVSWWSVATMLSGAATTVWHMAATRFALGVAEAGGWIASPRLVQQWFPQRERALAIGIYSSSAHFGAALAPIAITAMLLSVGWRWTFVVTGLVGLGWFALWMLLFRQKRTVPLTENVPEALPSPDAGQWLAVLRTRPVWTIAAANALTNPVWFFYLFWFPKYLVEERGLGIAAMGRLSWIVYAAAGVGAILGGILSGALVRRGMAPARARVTVMAMVALVAPVGALNALAPAVGISIALGAVVALAHTAWVTNQTALFVDLYDERQVGKGLAISNLVAGLVTMGSTYLVGQLVATLTYRPMFLVIAIAYPLGLVFAWLAIANRAAPREALA
ncbi:ACS family hexuronate transporter-like MFS transporter [Sphingomonas zeicaulis]|uniref:MFS transporter n=1 Tax=Sphingomonas zeicaulis TaxID=1632740 RepID=UPI003D24A09E